MRLLSIRTAVAALALTAISCSENDITGPGKGSPDALTLRTDVVTASMPAVRISEFHYDNSGTDTGERIEISMPLATDTAGYRIQLYNGNGGAFYNTRSLGAGTVAVTACANGTRKVVVLTYPVDGIQNGSPDAIALIAPDNSVVEFLSYEGSMTGVGGFANGMLAPDIGVSEPSDTPVGHSLKRTGTGTWQGPSENNFGQCNDDETGPAVVDSVAISPDGGNVIEGNTLQLSATAFDAGDQQIPGTTFTWTSRNEAAATVSATGLVTGVEEGTAWIVAATTNGKADSVVVTVEDAPPVGTGETFISEIHYDDDGADANERVEIEGPAGANLAGWSLILYNGNGGASYATINLSGVFPDLCTGRGVLTFAAVGMQNGDPDGIALVAPGSVVVEFISYEGTFTATNGAANGMTSTDIGVRETGSRDETYSLQRYDDDWYGPSPASTGACNGPPPPPSISFSGRNNSDPALPVGFQDQLFATLTDASGNVLDTAYIWSSDTPGTASIDQDGVITSLAAGSATFRATLKNSTITNTWTLPMTVATASGLIYPGNTEFGIPTDSNPADDFIVTYDYFTSSFSSSRNIPNWVSYNIDAQYIAGPNDRCDCFTYDPGLPGTPYTTADYTGAGDFHGYGIDRGHLARSFDRTAGALDNAHTFYFSNIIPQAADNNQGPWGAMEIYLGDFARFQNKEVYVIAGATGSKGTVKNEGLITIPEYVWKVAVIMDRDEGLDDVQSTSDIEVIAVVMPNIPGIRNVDWNTYRVTVDSVESLSGYDVLALLADPVEIAVESETVAPVAATDGPYAALENESIPMSGAASSDADGDDLTYAWDFGDGNTATGVSVSHAYATAGTYDVQLIVTDIRGLADTVVTQAVIETPSDAAEDAIAVVQQLFADGKLNKGNANSFISKLQAAISSLANGNENAALGQLNALLNQIDAFVRDGKLSAGDAAELRELVVRTIASISQ